MQTRFWRLSKEQPDRGALAEAAEIIRTDGLIAFPTETVYGLGANGLSALAVEKIFAAKGRPSDNPLILHIADYECLENLTSEVPPNALALMAAFWPGPLTLVLKKSALIPDNVTAGLDTVAIRMPASDVALGLIELAKVPLAAPSANLSGRPSPTLASAVEQDLSGRIDGIIDAGGTDIGLESTVVDCTCKVPVLLRPGAVTVEQLIAVLGVLDFSSGFSSETPAAPGMKYRHYAPQAPVYLLAEDFSQPELKVFVEQVLAAGKRVGVLAGAADLAGLPEQVVGYGGWQGEDDLAGLAANLYSWLRGFDEAGVDLILSRQVKTDGLGLAIMNRLHKAAGGREIRSGEIFSKKFLAV